MTRPRIAHKVQVRVNDPLPTVDAVEMDLRPDIVKYADIKFNGVEHVPGPKAKNQYKVWMFTANGQRKHLVEVWKDTYKQYNSMCLAVDGDRKLSGSKTDICFRYPWFREFITK